MYRIHWGAWIIFKFRKDNFWWINFCYNGMCNKMMFLRIFKWSTLNKVTFYRDFHRKMFTEKTLVAVNSSLYQMVAQPTLCTCERKKQVCLKIDFNCKKITYFTPHFRIVFWANILYKKNASNLGKPQKKVFKLPSY